MRSYTKHTVAKHTTHLSTGKTGSTRLDSIAFRTGASAAELPPWSSHPEPVGCELYGTMAVRLHVRSGFVFVLGAERCEVRIVAGEVADPGPVGLQ